MLPLKSHETLWQGLLLMSPFWHVFAWSLTQLATGRWAHLSSEGVALDPSTPDGARPGSLLANGYRGLIVAATGDLEFLASGYHLPNPRGGEGVPLKLRSECHEHSPKPQNICPFEVGEFEWPLCHHRGWIACGCVPQHAGHP